MAKFADSSVAFVERFDCIQLMSCSFMLPILLIKSLFFVVSVLVFVFIEI